MGTTHEGIWYLEWDHEVMSRGEMAQELIEAQDSIEKLEQQRCELYTKLHALQDQVAKISSDIKDNENMIYTTRADMNRLRKLYNSLKAQDDEKA